MKSNSVAPPPVGLYYSPLPPEAYTRPDAEVGKVGVGLVFVGRKDNASWNLCWLSMPLVDRFLVVPFCPGTGIDLKMIQVCYATVNQQVGGRVLRELLLTESAPMLVAHIKAHPHTHLATYKYGKKAWLATIESRAGSFRGAISQSGNVISVSFGRR